MSAGATPLERLADARLIAVLRAPSSEGAVAAAEALIGGGVRAVEVTHSTPEAPDAIRELHERHGAGVLLAVGTVREAAEVAPAVEAGAEIVVSPGTDAEVLGAAREAGVAALPGVFTATDAMRAMALGAEAVKLFPGSVGGPGLLRALREPFPGLGFVPTGGVTPENAAEWFDAGALAVGAGGSLCPADDIAAGHFDAIRERAERFVSATRRSRP